MTKTTGKDKEAKGLGLALALAALFASGAHADQVPLEALKGKADPFAQMAGAIKFQRSVPISDDKTRKKAVPIGGEEEYAITPESAKEAFEKALPTINLETLGGFWKLVADVDSDDTAGVYRPSGMPDSRHPDQLEFVIREEAKGPFGSGQARKILFACRSWSFDKNRKSDDGWDKQEPRCGIYKKEDEPESVGLVEIYERFFPRDCRLLDEGHLFCSHQGYSYISYWGYERADQKKR